MGVVIIKIVPTLIQVGCCLLCIWSRDPECYEDIEARAGGLSKPEADTQPEGRRGKSLPTHLCPAPCRALSMCSNKCLLSESINDVLEMTWVEMRKSHGM